MACEEMAYLRYCGGQHFSPDKEQDRTHTCFQVTKQDGWNGVNRKEDIS